jgi:hypothetical protein
MMLRRLWILALAVVLGARLCAAQQGAPGGAGPGAPLGGAGAVSSSPTNLLGMPGYVNAAGMWYTNPYLAGPNTGSVAGVQYSYYCAPIWIFQPVHLEGLGIRITLASAGNSNGALAAAIFSDLLTTGNVHRPGAFVDTVAAPFVTSGSGQVSQPLLNGNDAVSPGLNWLCMQTFDATVAYLSLNASASYTPLVSAIIGTPTLANATGTVTLDAVSTTGSGFNCTASACSVWPSFTSGAVWTELTSSIHAPELAIEIYSVP